MTPAGNGNLIRMRMLYIKITLLGRTAGDVEIFNSVRFGLEQHVQGVEKWLWLLSTTNCISQVLIT